MSSNTYYFMDALGWCPGFFSSYQSVIGFLDFCEKQTPIGFEVFFEKGLYFESSAGPNWWEYYFEPIKYGQIQGDTIVNHIGDTPKSRWCTEVISIMSRERAHEIISKYIKVKPHIQNKIDNFVQSSFGDYTVGVHYRGTDKTCEAPRVAFDVAGKEIQKRIPNVRNYKIFVATDEAGFLSYMKSQFGNHVIHIDAIRSQTNEPVHHLYGEGINPIPGNKYIIGEEAVIDCYLLSKTNLLIKTHSNLSSSSANINPQLPTVDLNQATYCKGLR